MRTGYIQFSPSFGKKEKNIERIKEILGDNNVDILVLPELFTTGYTFLSRKEAEKYGESIPGPTTEIFCEISKKRNMYVAGSIVEKENDKIFNTSFITGPSGYIGKYRKMHLFFEEKEIFDPGDTGFPVFTLDEIKVGLLICFDWIFPESIRSLALQGAQIILHSANLVLPYCQDAMITRSIENRVFIITANRVGYEKRGKKEYIFTGKSQIVAPGGRILIRDEPKREGFRYAKIDPYEANNKKINRYNDLFKDRRRKYYIL